ncbi:unnamed protein product [Urochloa decumbens]|uniref:Leucine-rich repeat-containing N-terminal plant-type domain-containing protein n=2 Tax=Urochloa decumbens TaxID=240449 RepID=A0ABC8ZP70_9POAL
MAHCGLQQAELLLLLQILLAITACSLLPSYTGAYTSNHTAGVPPVPCLPDQAAALLRLKRSFTVTNYSAIAFRSWRAGTDCCRWMGVRCGYNGGLVTFLDLGGRGLKSGGLEPALFDLTSLRYLNLASNDFNGSQLPSTGFERLTELTHLNLSTSSFSGQVPNGIGHLTNLVSLDLSTNFEFTETIRYVPNIRVHSISSVSGPICGSLLSLRSLSVIDLQYNMLSGPIPDFFSNLSDLSVLILSYNKFQGWIPPAIFQHKKLVTIDLYLNHGISGYLPNFTNSTTSLEILNVGRTNFSGTIPTSIGNLTSLKRLGLGATSFSGELPSSIGTLKSLSELEISGLGIVGFIPSWVANLTSLTILEFSDCGLSGPVPSFVSNLTKLQKLALCDCSFSGEIPSYISNLVQLQTVLLYSNNFIGKMEFTFFRKLTHLSILDLSNNDLVVVDGANDNPLASSPKLNFLRLSHCNISTYPNFLRNQDQITWLDLSYNQIHGAIPKWAWDNFPNFPSVINLTNNKLTSVGYAPFLPVHSWKLDLSYNMLEGFIPIPLGPALLLDYSNNKFSSLPSNFSTHLHEVGVFKASSNKLSGKIPLSFCDVINIQMLDLSYNNFSGSIPSCLMENVNGIESLKLKENKLTGQFPDNIKERCSFEALDFSGNWIGGQLPRSLVNCKNLEVLDIGNNQISDYFPCWMNTLVRLQVLILKSNKFFGQVVPSTSDEKDHCKFPTLRVLDLASNNFSGTLTKAWFTKLKSMIVKSENVPPVTEYLGIYKITTLITYKGFDVTISNTLWSLVYIDISSNAFCGSIPESIGVLAMLNMVNMSRNSLTGPIPSQLGRLSQIEALDLSFNELSGTIPQELASLDFLSTLNLSYNKLEGRIPESPHFMTFSHRSFLGNNGLCGPPLSKECIDTASPTVVSHHSVKKSVDIMSFLFTGSGFGAGFAIAVVMSWRMPTRK